jgi:hypothetical protein
MSMYTAGGYSSQMLLLLLPCPVLCLSPIACSYDSCPLLDNCWTTHDTSTCLGSDQLHAMQDSCPRRLLTLLLLFNHYLLLQGLRLVGWLCGSTLL